jgi:D-alanyl-D-alanine carboxypeptidase
LGKRKVELIKAKLGVRLGFIAMLSVAVVFAASPAGATAQWRRVHKTTHSSHSKRHARAAAGPLYKGALLEDADTGRVLLAYNADMEWPPASMAKMMLLLADSAPTTLSAFPNARRIPAARAWVSRRATSIRCAS